MAVSFPTSLDTFTEPSTPSSTALSSAGDGSRDHITHHTDLGNAVEALEAKVGADGSAVTTSLDYKVGRSWQLIGSTRVAGSNAASIAFASIPGTYKHLMLVLAGRGDGAFGQDNIIIRVNSDSSAIYDYQYVQGANATLSGAAAVAQTAWLLGNLPCASATASLAGSQELIIADYAGTTFHKAAVGRALWATDNTAANQILRSWGGKYRSASAITDVSIAFITAGNNLVIGSIASLYGMS
jgi:hypothetical protein